jgi:glycerate kinase
MARACGKPVVAIAGTIRDYDASSGMFDAVEASSPAGMPLDEAMRRGAELVADAAERAVRAFV